MRSLTRQNAQAAHSGASMLPRARFSRGISHLVARIRVLVLDVTLLARVARESESAVLSSSAPNLELSGGDGKSGGANFRGKSRYWSVSVYYCSVTSIWNGQRSVPVNELFSHSPNVSCVPNARKHLICFAYRDVIIGPYFGSFSDLLSLDKWTRQSI